MNQGDERDSFWYRLETKVEEKARSIQTGKSSIAGLLITPIVVFIRSYFLKGNFLKGRYGYREAIHRAIFVFSVNARQYEMNNIDKKPLEQIKKEWN